MAKMVDDVDSIDKFEENEIRKEQEAEERGDAVSDKDLSVATLLKMLEDLKEEKDHWIEIGDNSSRVAGIWRISKRSKYQNGGLVYGIMVNEDNRTFTEYNNAYHRDKAYADIKEKLVNFKNVKFI